MVFTACLHKVSNRGVPPVEFLEELIKFGRKASAEIFDVKKGVFDVYSSIYHSLGPWEGEPGSSERLLHRKAVMLECLRVLAGYESSWRWTCGLDTTNPANDTPEEEETGIFQVSANSMNFGQDLRDLVTATCGSRSTSTFIKQMKVNKPLAVEYAARLLRHTTRHNGPVRDHIFDDQLWRPAVTEFKLFLQPGMESTVT